MMFIGLGFKYHKHSRCSASVSGCGVAHRYETVETSYKFALFNCFEFIGVHRKGLDLPAL